MPIKERGTLGGRETKIRIGIILPANRLLERGHGGGETTAAQVVEVGSQNMGAKSSVKGHSKTHSSSNPEATVEGQSSYQRAGAFRIGS